MQPDYFAAKSSKRSVFDALWTAEKKDFWVQPILREIRLIPLDQIILQP